MKIESCRIRENYVHLINRFQFGTKSGEKIFPLRKQKIINSDAF